MRDAILGLAIVMAAFFWIQMGRAREDADVARAAAESMARQMEIQREHYDTDTELRKGGADEALSDYGRDAARKLWPGN